MKPSPIWKLLQVFCRVVTTLLFDLKVYGSHRFPREGGVLLVSNHQSYLDPLLLGVRLPRTLSYMAKASLFKIAPFAWFIRSLGAFPVRQGEGDIRALKEAIERAQDGHALMIFPEGSRTENGELLPIEPGIALVIRKAKVPVVPAVIDGSSDAWPHGRKFFRAKPIRILYGKPMDLTGMSRDEIVEKIGGVFRSMLQELREGRVPLDRRDL
ncbi:MAG TPA: lysophospholipid acyltransferase family protein [Tepidisphaeraceae bacterium]|jgi:1-acyl-sn-glycerol-3-phosphate acyltransferase